MNHIQQTLLAKGGGKFIRAGLSRRSPTEAEERKPLIRHGSLRESPHVRPCRLGLIRFAVLLFSIALCIAMTGCFGFLKPIQSTSRYFVLTPVAVKGQAAETAASMAVGLGQVKVPAYLFNTSLAVRKGTNEVEYLPSALWAERLDTGFQRVLAADLAAALPTDRVVLSLWRPDDVAAEIYVTVEQFDLDTRGRGLLVARWRILSPGGDKVLKAGSSRLSREGPAPDSNLSGAVATLSELTAEFSRELARALEETTSARN